MTTHPEIRPAASPVDADAPEAFGLRIRETVSNFPPVDSWDDVADSMEGAVLAFLSGDRVPALGS